MLNADRSKRFGPIARNTGRAELRWGALLFVSFALVSQAADAGRLFRFRDERGVMHMGTGLPPGQAQFGYEILDGRTLRVLDVVKPAPTPAQLAQQAEQQRAAAVAAKEAQARREAAMNAQNHDRMLVETYANESDLVRLRDTKLGNLDLILHTTEKTIDHLRQNLTQMQTTAAEHRGAGRAPPDILLAAEKRTTADLADQEQAAQRTRAEQVAVRAQFDADLDRYRALTGSLKTASP